MKFHAVAACVLAVCVVAVNCEPNLPPNMPMNLLQLHLPAVFNTLKEILAGLIGKTTECLNEEQEFLNSQLNCDDKRGLELDERDIQKRMPMHRNQLKLFIFNVYYNAFRQQEFLRACRNRLADLRGEPRVEVTDPTGGTTSVFDITKAATTESATTTEDATTTVDATTEAATLEATT